MANYLRSQGCNHTCETILTMVNTVYEEHNQLPKCLAVQADNARTNKGWLVLGFLGVYVLNGVFEEARLRFCLEDHAHDIYDAFQGICAAIRCLVKHNNKASSQWWLLKGYTPRP